MRLPDWAKTVKRRKPQPAAEPTFLEAVEIMLKINQALENDNHVEVFKLCGITDEVAQHIDSAAELYEIATVRIANIARIARVNLGE
jgi:hypothetical protein